MLKKSADISRIFQGFFLKLTVIVFYHSVTDISNPHYMTGNWQRVVETHSSRTQSTKLNSEER